MFVKGKSRKIFFPSNTLIYGISRDSSKSLAYALVSTWSSVSSGWEHVKRKMHRWTADGRRLPICAMILHTVQQYFPVCFICFCLEQKKIFFFTLLPRFFQHIMARHRYFRAFCLFVFSSFYLSILVFVHLCWPTLILDHLRQFSKFSLAVESAIFYLYQITSDSIARLNFDNCVRIYERYTAKGDFFSSK